MPWRPPRLGDGDAEQVDVGDAVLKRGGDAALEQGGGLDDVVGSVAVGVGDVLVVLAAAAQRGGYLY